MTHALCFPLPDPAALAALAAQVRVWLLGVLAWLLDATGAGRRLPPAVRGELIAEIAAARDEVFDILVGRLRLVLRPQRRTRPRAPAHADPHLSRITARRALTRGLIARPRGLSARLRALVAALDSMDTLVRRAIARIAQFPKGAWITVSAPAAPLETRTRSPAYEDSS